MRQRAIVLVLILATVALAGDGLRAQGLEEASRLYLNHSVFLLRQAQRYVERSYATYQLPGFDYRKAIQEMDLVSDGVETFLNPRSGTSVRVVPVEIDGHYLSDELLQETKRLQEEESLTTPDADASAAVVGEEP